MQKINVCEKDYVCNPVTCNGENGKYLASIMDDSAVICDEVIDADVDADVKVKSNNKAKSNYKSKSNV